MVKCSSKGSSGFGHELRSGQERRRRAGVVSVSKYRLGDGFRLIKGRSCESCVLCLLELHLKKQGIDLRLLWKIAYPKVRLAECYNRGFALKHARVPKKIGIAKLLNDLEEYNLHRLREVVAETAKLK
jgi:hypothetical protein